MRATQEAGLQILKKLGDKGDVDSLYELGLAYSNPGHRLSIDINYETAFNYFMRAAQGGHTAAHEKVGWAYEFSRGVEEDCEKAVEHYEIAAQAGNKDAQFRLFLLYRLPTFRDKVGHKSSKYYLEQAAQNGHPRAQYELGMRLWNTAKNHHEALYWFTCAILQGHDLSAQVFATICEENDPPLQAETLHKFLAEQLEISPNAT